MLYDEDGNKVEGVVTKEDHEKQLADAATLALANAQKEGKVVSKDELDKIAGEKTKLEEDLKAAQEALDKGSDKDKNFAELRKQKEQAEKDLKEYKDSISKELGEIKNQLGSSEMNTAIAQLADGDVEMEKKIKFHLARIVRSEDTAEERKQKLVDAATLARGSRPAPNLMAGIIGSASGVDKDNMGGFAQSGDISPEAKALASKFGLSDKDIAKFGKK